MDKKKNVLISQQIKQCWQDPVYRKKVTTGVNLAYARKKAIEIIDNLIADAMQNRAV